MKLEQFFLALFITLLVVLPSGPASAGYTYIPEMPGAIYTFPNGINDAGVIVGYYGTTDRTYGFVYQNGTYTTLNVPGSYTQTIAYDISDSGTVVGTYDIQELKYDPYWGYYWETVYYNFTATMSDGTWTYTTLPKHYGNYQITATGINDNGVIVGYAQDVVLGGNTKGFAYDGTNLQVIEYTGPVEGEWPVTSTVINKINNEGVMVGSYTYAFSGTGGFVYDGSTFSQLPENDDMQVAWFSLNGINDLGHIVGSYQYDQLTYAGLFYNGTACRGISFSPMDINNHDVVVGRDTNGLIWIWTPEFCECDLNHDGRCDMQDWLLFGQQWGWTVCLTPGVTCACDINTDGRCDMRDWLLFGKSWGRTDCPLQ